MSHKKIVSITNNKIMVVKKTEKGDNVHVIIRSKTEGPYMGIIISRKNAQNLISEIHEALYR